MKNNRRLYNFSKPIDNTYSCDKDFVPLPSRAKRIVGVCPKLINGKGFISVFREADKFPILTDMLVKDDPQPFGRINVDTNIETLKNNVRYVLRLDETDISKNCYLHLYIIYEEE
ncbi:MAG: hypothetical protein IJ933_00610 [Bacteroidales bacterium]|nr:hypothetical protein [Bacteroidales bacterium]